MGAFIFYVDKVEGGRGLTKVYASAEASVDKLSTERERGVKKYQNNIYLDCESPLLTDVPILDFTHRFRHIG